MGAFVNSAIHSQQDGSFNFLTSQAMQLFALNELQESFTCLEKKISVIWSVTFKTIQARHKRLPTLCRSWRKVFWSPVWTSTMVYRAKWLSKIHGFLSLSKQVPVYASVTRDTSTSRARSASHVWETNFSLTYSRVVLVLYYTACQPRSC